MQRADRLDRPVTPKWPGGRRPRCGRAMTKNRPASHRRLEIKVSQGCQMPFPVGKGRLAAGARSSALANAWRSFPTPIRPSPASRAMHGPGRCPAHERAAPAPPPCRRRGSGHVGRADLQERPRPRPQVLLGKRPSLRDAGTEAPKRQRRACRPPRPRGTAAQSRAVPSIGSPFRFSCIVSALPGPFPPRPGSGAARRQPRRGHGRAQAMKECT